MWNSKPLRVVSFAVLSALSLSDVTSGRIRWTERPVFLDRRQSPGNIGNFGSCSVPEIEFGAGYDDYDGTRFRPADQQSYNHGSAKDIDTIATFICNTLANTCNADQTARSTCSSAQSAADQQTAMTGTQADAFNKVFGITTDFANVTPLDDQGDPFPSNDPFLPAYTGTCSTPEIMFAPGLEGRKETAFAPVDQSSYGLGSSDDINTVAQFICDALTNTCKAGQLAKTLCTKATNAANAATPGTGAQADAFNAVFGETTDYAYVTPLDNTGKPING